MRFFELKMRLIAPLVVMCCLIGVASRVAQAQAPTSGALLTINGTVGATPVNLSVSDKDIHSGVFNVVFVGAGSNCTAGDQISTDAYVLQGGSATGCDPGDAFEVTDSNPNSVHQQPGMLDLTGTGFSFHIDTHYICSGGCSGFPAATFVATCNTSGTICTSRTGPDTGFLTVTNTSNSSFTGTITLSGTSPIAGPPFCPVNGMASDSFTGTLNPTPTITATTTAATTSDPSSVTLALGSQGTVAAPSPSDSSNCGGFTSATPQQPIAPGTTTTFLDGKIFNQSVQLPADATLGGAAFMSVSFMNTAQGDCDSILSASATNGPNTWSGGARVPAGSTCTIIADTGTSSANDTPIVTQNLCFDSNHNLLPRTTTSPDSCNINVGPSGTKIQLTSQYQTESGLMQPNPAYFICSDNVNDCANITTDPLCCTVSGGTNRINSRELVGSLPALSTCLLYDPAKAVKSGATISLKMYLCDSTGSDVSGANVVVHATRLVKTTATTTDLMIDDAGNANPDSDFRFDPTLGTSGGYIFNLKTTGLTTGTYNLYFTAGFNAEQLLGLPSFTFTFQVK